MPCRSCDQSSHYLGDCRHNFTIYHQDPVKVYNIYKKCKGIKKKPVQRYGCLPSESMDKRREDLRSLVTMTEDLSLGFPYPCLFLAVTRKK